MDDGGILVAGRSGSGKTVFCQRIIRDLLHLSANLSVSILATPKTAVEYHGVAEEAPERVNFLSEDALEALMVKAVEKIARHEKVAQQPQLVVADSIEEVARTSPIIAGVACLAASGVNNDVYMVCTAQVVTSLPTTLLAAFQSRLEFGTTPGKALLTTARNKAPQQVECFASDKDEEMAFTAAEIRSALYAIKASRRATLSTLQRALDIGYNQAGHLMFALARECEFCKIV